MVGLKEGQWGLHGNCRLREGILRQALGAFGVRPIPQHVLNISTESGAAQGDMEYFPQSCHAVAGGEFGFTLFFGLHYPVFHSVVVESSFME